VCHLKELMWLHSMQVISYLSDEYFWKDRLQKGDIILILVHIRLIYYVGFMYSYVTVH